MRLGVFIWPDDKKTLTTQMLCQDVTKGQLYRDSGQQKLSAPYSPTLLQTKLNEKQVQKMTSISIAPPRWHRHTHTHLHTYTLTTPSDQVTGMLTKYIPCAYTNQTAKSLQACGWYEIWWDWPLLYPVRKAEAGCVRMDRPPSCVRSVKWGFALSLVKMLTTVYSASIADRILLV